MILVALHGFFGSPEDWDRALLDLDPGMEFEVILPDLGVWATRAGVTDFDSFAESFNRSVRLFSEERGEPVMIAGYSLGARLAAHCVLESPDLYQSALLVSMNPGLPSSDLQTRRERFEADGQWAQRMREKPWAETWKAWNEQAVLRPGPRSRRKPGRSDEEKAEQSRKLEGRREAWARAMEIWSLGVQQDLREGLVSWAKEGSRKLTLMTGTDDAKFTEITADWLAKAGVLTAQESSLEGPVKHRQVLGAGHRILDEASEELVSEITALVSRP